MRPARGAIERETQAWLPELSRRPRAPSSRTKRRHRMHGELRPAPLLCARLPLPGVRPADWILRGAAPSLATGVALHLHPGRGATVPAARAAPGAGQVKEPRATLRARACARSA